MTGRKLITSRGFTLVELLVAITIIGLLMAVAIPAINRALGTARMSAVRSEVEVLSQGVEAYKLKYGDYPPDFSDWNLAVRHYRMAFPDIAVRELTILQRQIVRGNGMDRAEALVWNLGGFSSDPQRPFTGPGGPLQEITPHIESDDTHPSNFAYNSSRDNALIDFDLTRITMGEYNPAIQTALSTEEGSAAGDLFPVYLRTNGRSPYIYFDSRTYGFAAGEFNGYAAPTGRDWGRTRPYLSSAPVSPSEGAVSLGPAGGALAFMNPRSFQIISAGPDDSFGSLADFNNGPLYFAFPTGAAYTVDTSQTPPVAVEQSELARYGESNQANITDNHHLDNITNFAESVLENDLP